MSVARLEPPPIRIGASDIGVDADPGPFPWRQAVIVVCATVLALAGGFAVFVVALSGSVHDRAQTGLERQFSGRLAVGDAPVNQPIPTGDPVALLEVPAVGIREVVVEGTRPTQLTKGPGHLPVSALPGQAGVAVVLGRRIAFGAPFGRLDRLRPGDEIRSTTGQGTARYRVARTRTAAATDGTALTASGNALLLVTSDPPGRANRRLIVEARPAGRIAAPGRGSTAPVTAADLGLAGDSGALTPLLVALELLALVAVGLLFAIRRIDGSIVWLLGVPVVLAGAWIVFEQAALLLPATF
ncbi:MAG: sortase [Actinomycetota bacterium]